jgi:hypothetical protein
VRMTMKWWSVLALMFAVSMTPVRSDAVTAGICDPDAPGQCDVTIDFNAGTDTLTITLKNTSDDGFITAFSFDLGAGGVADIGVLTFTGDGAFPAFVLNPTAPSTGGDINVAPDGDREFVITATPPQYLGGGTPSDGIGPGLDATFVLTLSGDVSESSFFGPGGALVRERGFDLPEGLASDKDTLTQTPEPGTLLLVGTGLVSAGAWGRKRWFGRTSA